MQKSTHFLRIIGCFFLICSAFSLVGQTPGYQFRHLTVNDGLSHNQVNSFFQDNRGFLWIGTYSGLNRYDGYKIKVYQNDAGDSTSLRNNSVSRIFETPEGKLLAMTAEGPSLYDPATEKFTNTLNEFYTRYHLSSASLVDIVKDSSDNFWFIQSPGGVVLYRPNGEFLSVSHSENNPETISSNAVTGFASGKSGIWIIHNNGILEKIVVERNSYRVEYRNSFLFDRNGARTFDYRIMCDRDGDLWINAWNDPQGLFFFDAARREFRHFNDQAGPIKLNTNLISSIVEDEDGLFWVGSDHGGVNLIDKKTFSCFYIRNQPEEEKSIGQNSITTIYRDRQGILWFGTFKKGVSYYHKNIFRFPLYKHYPLSNTGLPYSDVNRFAEDDKGNLWIGTNGGGLIYFDRQKNSFTQFLHQPDNPNSISSNVIVSLFIDHEKKLWIGTYFGGLNVYDGKKFIHYRHDANDAESLADENIWEIFEDSRKRLWVGTMHGGLDLFDRKTGTFSHYQQNDMNSIRSNYIAAITEDREGNLWIGTGGGIDMLNREKGRFFHYEHTQGDKGSLSDNYVHDILEDQSGRIWIATRNGLNVFDPKINAFKSYRKSDGLPHNTVLTIQQDDAGNLWLGTPNGLSNAVLVEKNAQLEVSFVNYDEADGLQGKQFNENAAFRTKKGELIFGGANGFNLFHPSTLEQNKNTPQVVLSDLQLYNQSVSPGALVNGNVILPKSLSETQEITLPPSQNVFSIEFTALDYLNPQKNQYQYKMEGFHTHWLTADAQSRRVTFTNLDPGDYVFLVKASNSDGLWSDNVTSLKIKILPPFWKSQWAFLLYFFIVIGGFLVARKLIQQRERMKFEREQERQEAIRMHELDMMKIKFFTNVSHEFRTPLTLILTPMEKILRQTQDPDLKNQFQLIQRNARRLMNLVNQLLDFRKLEVQEVKFNPSEGDVIAFIKETVFSFSDISEKKDIRLSFESTVISLETIFDQDKLEKILFNLLSNAFKFTPAHGAVSVNVVFNRGASENELVISVRDTGIGIPFDKKEKIFERFFQNELPRSVVNQGSGIGLSITKEFVKSHGGTITVESEPGEGSCFVVTLPVKEVLNHIPEEIAQTYPDEQFLAASAALKKPVLLLVEDNEDFRFYLKDNLRHEYNIVEARNGMDGWKKALETLPDLIVSDIMMPEMNGIELCRRIKSDSRLSHTPIILLTARSAEEQKLEGFESGADDYISKPFNFEILVSRIRNLIHLREKIHAVFPAQLDVKASTLKITSLDEQFIQKAIQCVEENISNPDFSVENLSHELGISRAHFYKKIVALTGKSPLEFIRVIRLQHAAQLLEKSQLTVAEIAYKVGFNNPKYFARYFKEEYHMLPSVFASEKRKGAPGV